VKIRERKGTVTFEDFCWTVREDQKADLINGVIFMASPENTDSNRLFVWLLGLISDFVDHFELGEVFGSRVAFRLDEDNGPEPDIAFVNRDQLHRVHRGHVDGPANLAIEIVSPESVERDYGKKRKLYEKFGFDEYWIIDEELETVTLYRLDPHGKYREVRQRKGQLHSQALRGFWLRPEWLWQSPRPRKTDALNEILSKAK